MSLGWCRGMKERERDAVIDCSSRMKSSTLYMCSLYNSNTLHLKPQKALSILCSHLLCCLSISLVCCWHCLHDLLCRFRCVCGSLPNEHFCGRLCTDFLQPLVLLKWSANGNHLGHRQATYIVLLESFVQDFRNKDKVSMVFHKQMVQLNTQTKQCIQFHVKCNWVGWVHALLLVQFNIINSVKKSNKGF